MTVKELYKIITEELKEISLNSLLFLNTEHLVIDSDSPDLQYKAIYRVSVYDENIRIMHVEYERKPINLDDLIYITRSIMSYSHEDKCFIKVGIKEEAVINEYDYPIESRILVDKDIEVSANGELKSSCEIIFVAKES